MTIVGFPFLHIWARPHAHNDHITVLIDNGLTIRSYAFCSWHQLISALGDMDDVAVFQVCMPLRMSSRFIGAPRPPAA